MASWNKLADRCRLFTDRPRALLIELLKEAEEELVRKCDILEETHTFTAPLNLDTTTSNKQILPTGYKKMVSVYHKGIELDAIGSDDMYYNSSNTIYNGTPTGYHIENNNIVFNKAPKASDQFMIKYYTTMTQKHNNKLFHIQNASFALSVNSIDIDTSLGAELNGLGGKISGDLNNADVSSTITFTDMQLQSVSTTPYSVYVVTVSSGNVSGTTGDEVSITNYRSVAPIIPDHFHRNLCDYAIALSTPELHDKHMIMFENSINEIKNEDAERDLVHEVKKEVYNSANLYR